MSSISGRNNNLDIFRTIASFAVVFLHYNHVSGEIGELYSRIIFNLTKFAVPFFFMISGFYLIPQIERKRDKLYLKKILKMALLSSVFYIFFYLMLSPNRIEWLQNHYNVGYIAMWLTGQDDPAGFHLWYFYCLLWTFAISTYIVKHYSERVLYILAIVLVCYHFTGISAFYCYTQSFPAIALGVFLYKKRERVIKISSKKITIIGVLMIGFMCIQAYLNLSELGGFYEGHILALIFIIMAMCTPSVGGEILASIGVKYSSYIYILHVAVNAVLISIFEFDTPALEAIRPFLVFFISLAIPMLIFKSIKLMNLNGAYKV